MNRRSYHLTYMICHPFHAKLSWYWHFYFPSSNEVPFCRFQAYHSSQNFVDPWLFFCMFNFDGWLLLQYKTQHISKLIKFPLIQVHYDQNDKVVIEHHNWLSNLVTLACWIVWPFLICSSSFQSVGYFSINNKCLHISVTLPGVSAVLQVLSQPKRNLHSLAWLFAYCLALPFKQ